MNYQTIVVDNFFENPYSIIEYSKKNLFIPPNKKDPEQKWLGTRSTNLHSTNKKLFEFIVSKVLSFYFDVSKNDIIYNAKVYFHKSKNLKYDKKSLIHKDYGPHIAGLIYLNKNNDINTGTTIYDDKLNESLIVSNKFNSMICYDAKKLHGPTSLDTDRLTIPFFIHIISISEKLL